MFFVELSTGIPVLALLMGTWSAWTKDPALIPGLPKVDLPFHVSNFAVAVLYLVCGTVIQLKVQHPRLAPPHYKTQLFGDRIPYV